MKKKITFLMASLMLLTMVILPGTAVGQSTNYTTGTLPSGWSAAGGNMTMNSISWTYSSATHLSLNNSKLQIGSKNNPQTTAWTIQTPVSSFGDNKKIISIAITAYTTATSATYDISAGGSSVKSGSLTTSSSTYTASNLNVTSGNIVVTMTGSSSSKAMYLSNISITYDDASGPTTYTLSSAVTPAAGGTVSLSKTSLEEDETATATYTANAHYTFDHWSIYGTGASLSSTTDNSTTVTMGTANATVTANFTADPKYNITYNANYGDSPATVVDSDYAGETMTIKPYDTFSRTGFKITSWNTVAGGGGASYIAGASYTMTSAGLTLYAQWEESSTATLTATNLALTGSYNDSNDTEITIDGITYIHTDLMKNSSNIQAKASTGTIKNSTAYPGDITSVVITHSGTARATTIKGSADGTNWTQVATGSGSINADFSGYGYKYFQITRGDNAAYWTKVEINYSTNGSSLDPSDLEITNASTDLTFDLYPSATNQVINYTTSSTGAITITPSSPTSYFSYVHDATTKTITITPLAVTPSTQTVTISQAADDDYSVGEVSFTVSVANSAPFIPATYTLANSIVSGETYIIVGSNTIDEEISYFAMGEQRNTNRGGVEISVSGTTATVSSADVHEVTITALTGDDAGYYTIQDGGYLYAASSGANQLKTKETLDVHGKWYIEIDNGTFSIAADKSSNRNVMQFNYNQGSPIFNCYTSASQSPVYLYVKDEAQTFTLDIEQYPAQNNGWYLIASPVSVGIAANAMVSSDNYDLYRFNPSTDLEWENYKVHNFALLEVGRGYLYANGDEGGIQIGFTGWPVSNGEVNMPYEGWNLIGNPLTTPATIGDKDYYRINNTRTGIMAGTGNVAVMEGIFVKAASAGEPVTFTAARGTGEKSVNNALVINLNRNNKLIDRAIVRLSSNRQLSKLTLFDDDTKIYIPQNGADYAIAAMDDNTQAFNLNFHAKTTGKYTLSLGETNNLSYVHIFDRMTGEDVDMLLDDNYSFIGSPADSEERFIVRLSYNASSTGEETFAYQSGNGIIVNGEGTLEVYDVTGRKVMTTTINGVETINGLNSGVYVFRVTGETLKTQKIVVR